MIDKIRNRLFHTIDDEAFAELALQVFRYQAENCSVYSDFLRLMKVDPFGVTHITQIPFLPIEFFKSHRIVTGQAPTEIVFTSSGTTGTTTSSHVVTDVSLYRDSFLNGFTRIYGNPGELVILALLPSYLERSGSSLIYMMNDLIARSHHSESGFFLHDLDDLTAKLQRLDGDGKKVLLMGVSYALFDLIADRRFELHHTIVMETGGMKGRRKEMIREELHAALCDGFGVHEIHSEYGMTELLSQAYSKGGGIYEPPPWMKILIRDTEDPFAQVAHGKTGGINVIDLANLNSCAFIATQDLGKMTSDGMFEVLGRFDNSDIRGCNLLI